MTKAKLRKQRVLEESLKKQKFVTVKEPEEEEEEEEGEEGGSVAEQVEEEGEESEVDDEVKRFEVRGNIMASLLSEKTVKISIVIEP